MNMKFSTIITLCALFSLAGSLIIHAADQYTLTIEDDRWPYADQVNVILSDGNGLTIQKQIYTSTIIDALRTAIKNQWNSEIITAPICVGEGLAKEKYNALYTCPRHTAQHAAFLYGHRQITLFASSIGYRLW